MGTIETRVKQILLSWLEYQRWEDLTNAEIEAYDDHSPKNIIEQDVSLIGNNLMIKESLFKQLQQERKEKPEDFQMAVAFPRLYSISSNRRKFRPLFTIDISGIFAEKYKTKGWDVTSFPFQPVIPNLINLYNLDEEEAENLVTLEGIKVFLETTFKHSFNTLQDFLERLEIPEQIKYSKPLPYLLRFNYGNYSYNLKKDLKKIQQDSQFTWLKENNPAYLYLFGQPTPTVTETLFYGAFPTKKPTHSQALAIKHFKTNPLTSVIGPPGSGKTILLLQAISQQVVKRAIQLATTGVDESNLTLVTSTNNRAVSNVVERLFALDKNDKFFFLEGGSKDIINQKLIPSMQAAIDWLETEKFNETLYLHLQQKILIDIKQLREQRHLNQGKQEKDVHRLNQLKTEIQSLESLKKNLQEEQIATPQSVDYSKYPLEAYELILPQLEWALRVFKQNTPPKKNKSWWQKLLSAIKNFIISLKSRSNHQIFKQFKKRIELPLTATLATPFPFQLPLTYESLVAAYYTVSEQISLAQQKHNALTTVTDIDNLQHQLNKLIEAKNQLEKEIALNKSKDFYSSFYTDFHQLQVQIFESSKQYLQQEALRCKNEVIESYKTYIDFLSKDYEAYRKVASTGKTIWQDLSLLFPVITSTLHSIRNLFPFPDSGCLDCVIVDEAGMIPQHLLFPALVRANKAFVVGDPQQIEPIIPFSHQMKEQYYTEVFLNQGLTEADYERYSPTVSTAYHRAAGGSGLGDNGNGILLAEHYRCVPPIINFCAQISNYKLDVKTPNRPSLLGPNLIAYHVEGQYRNHANLEEVEAIVKLVQHLIDGGYSSEATSDKAIGVISPYRSQADMLRVHILKQYPNLTDDSIGSVYTFQGGQKAAMILSTRQCLDSQSFQFINQKPNLLNVAVSRAEELFILVGNLTRLTKAGGYTKQLVEYISKYGELRELP